MEEGTATPSNREADHSNSSSGSNSSNSLQPLSETPPAADTPPALLPPPSSFDRVRTTPMYSSTAEAPANVVPEEDWGVSPASSTAAEDQPTRGRAPMREIVDPPPPVRCINPASDINARLDTQVEVKVYPCNNSQSGGKKKFTSFTIKPEGVVIQGSNRNRSSAVDLGAEYAMQIGRKLQRYELSDTRACQLLVTTHGKSFWVVPAPEAFSRHSGTCRLLGDRKHPPASHTLAVGDFLRVGSVGVVVIETHDGVENRVLSEEKIQKIMKDTTNSGGFLDLGETDGGEWVYSIVVVFLE
jgi:hypothetical protein